MRLIFDVVRDGLFAINSSAEQMATARQQVTTGRRTSAASEDPTAAAQAIGEHATIGTIDAYTSTASAASARLAAADTVLNGYIDKLTAAITAAMGARGSTATADSRAAAALQIRGLRDSLVGDINTKFGGTYLFSGARTDTTAYVPAGGGAWTYQGDNAAVQVEVESGRLVSVTADGQAIAQGGDATDVFTTLENLAAAVQAGDANGMGAGIDAVDRAFDRAVQAQGRLGVDERGVTDATSRLSALRLAADARRSKIEDANLAESITKMNQADTAYKAALGAVSSAERLSLLDYLR
jgi:flagellar hook-associated protein 3 FlgL